MRRQRYWTIAGALAVTAAGFVWWRAWVCDDAFITFRCVANLRAGHGPVFNPGERVQAFTHPLWCLLLLAGSFVADLYATAVALGIALTVGLVLVLGWLWRDGPYATVRLVLVTTLLLSSRTFIEFQTSGLETGLTSLLVALTWGWMGRMAAVVRDHAGCSPEPAHSQVIDQTPPLFRAALLCALLLLNRPDHVFLCGPTLLWLSIAGLRAARRRQQIARLTAGLSPLIAWHAFATVYYGTPLPNTAYAKIAFPMTVALRHGLTYARDYAAHEPLHAVMVVGALLASTVVAIRGLTPGAPSGMRAPTQRAAGARGPSLPLVAGLWLHVAYVIGVGGDFMRGRFFLPVLVGTLVLAGALVQYWIAPHRYRRKPASDANSSPRRVVSFSEAWRWPAALAGTVGALALAGYVALHDRTPRSPQVDRVTGIADEWAFYAAEPDATRFREPTTRMHPEADQWVRRGELLARYAESRGPITVMDYSIGLLAYHAGPKVHVIDAYGLADAFVARCPARADSRIGHVIHDIPDAYRQARGAINALPDAGRRLVDLDPTLTAHAQAMTRQAIWTDPVQQRRWQIVRDIVSGKVFSSQRWRQIPSFVLGGP